MACDETFQPGRELIFLLMTFDARESPISEAQGERPTGQDLLTRAWGIAVFTGCKKASSIRMQALRAKSVDRLCLKSTKPIVRLPYASR